MLPVDGLALLRRLREKAARLRLAILRRAVLDRETGRRLNVLGRKRERHRLRVARHGELQLRMSRR